MTLAHPHPSTAAPTHDEEHGGQQGHQGEVAGGRGQGLLRARQGRTLQAHGAVGGQRLGTEMHVQPQGQVGGKHAGRCGQTGGPRGAGMP